MLVATLLGALVVFFAKEPSDGLGLDIKRLYQLLKLCSCLLRKKRVYGCPVELRFRDDSPIVSLFDQGRLVVESAKGVVKRIDVACFDQERGLSPNSPIPVSKSEPLISVRAPDAASIILVRDSISFFTSASLVKVSLKMPSTSSSCVVKGS